MTKPDRRRVAVVLSHPVQHFCPQYSSWARLPNVELHVFFASTHGLSTYWDKDFGRDVQWQGLDLDFPHSFLPGAEGRSVDIRTDASGLDEALTAFGPDAVVLYGYAQRLQRRAARWARARGITSLMISDSELHSARPWPRRLAKAVWLPRMFASLDGFLTVGDSNEAYYRHYGVADSRMVRCPFPIDVEHYDRVLAERRSERERVRRELGIPDEHTVVLMVGKLVPWKRQRDLVWFSNQCQGVREDVTVVLAGTGRDEALLRRETQREGPGGVLFAGFVDPKELASYYCAADIYAHCSSQEPQALAISEATYCGLPIVVSDRCGAYGPCSVVQPGRNGQVYACGHLPRLSWSLETLIDDRLLRRTMGRASAELARHGQQLAHGAALAHALQWFLVRPAHELDPVTSTARTGEP